MELTHSLATSACVLSVRAHMRACSERNPKLAPFSAVVAASLRSFAHDSDDVRLASLHHGHEPFQLAAAALFFVKTLAACRPRYLPTAASDCFSISACLMDLVDLVVGVVVMLRACLPLVCKHPLFGRCM